MTRLGHFGQMAKGHWKERLPKMYQSLQASGKLEQVLLEAQERASNERADLILKGFQVHEAEEIVLPKYILLTSEEELEEMNPDGTYK